MSVESKLKKKNFFFDAMLRCCVLEEALQVKIQYRVFETYRLLVEHSFFSRKVNLHIF